MITTWVLVMAVYAYGGSTIVVPGFDTKTSCQMAGDQIRADSDWGKRISISCVRQDKPKGEK